MQPAEAAWKSLTELILKKSFDRMQSEKSQLKAGIILNYINLILGNLIPIFYTPVMLGLLGQNEYGLYKLSSGFTSYLSLISLGIGAAVTRYLIKANTIKGKDEEEKILGLFMVIFQVIAVCAFIVGTLLTLNLQIWYGNALTPAELDRMKVLVFLMVCNTALNFQLTPYSAVVTAHEKFIFLQCTNIITTCVGPVLNLILLYMGFASVGVAAGSLALGILVRFITLYYVRRVMNIRANYRNMPTYLLKEILTFSFWVFLANIVVQLYNATDTVMIGAVPGLATAGVAIYNVGAVFNGMVFGLTTGLSTLITPRANRMVFSGASSEELTGLAIRIGRMQGCIITLLVTGFIAFGRPFISFYAGEEYKDAYWVAVLMMVPNMIPLVQSVCLSIIVAQNKHRFRSLVYLGIAILNVVGTWFLLQTPLGIVGAALMTGVALIIGQGFIMNWYYHTFTGLNMIRFWKEVSNVYPIPIIMCVISILLGHFIDNYRIKVLLAGIVIYTVIYCVAMWFIVLNDYEKRLLRSLVPKKKR